jgi:arylsulfatase A-like enzyme
LQRGERAGRLPSVEGDLHHVDRELGNFLSDLRSAGVLDSLLLVVTSDHGENFGDHGFIEHQYCLFDTLLHVPLLIRYPPRVPGGLKVANSVSTLRVADTILDLIGAAGPLVSLLRQQQPEPLFAETDRMPPEKLSRVLQDSFTEVVNRRFQRQLRSVRQGGYKLFTASDGHEELYHVAVDPLELHDIIRSAPEIAARLRLLLSDYEKRRRPSSQGPRELDPETRDALKALGYVE